MICTFFGRQDTPCEVKALLKSAVVDMIVTEGVNTFLVGNNGRFDYYAQCVLQELKDVGADIDYSIVLSRPNEKALSNHQNATVFPEEMENIIPRFAISKRNDWMIRQSSFVIAYAPNQYSNSGRWCAKARKRGLKVIDLG